MTSENDLGELLDAINERLQAMRDDGVEWPNRETCELWNVCADLSAAVRVLGQRTASAIANETNGGTAG